MLRLAFDIAGSNREGELVDCLVPVRRFDAPQLVRHIGRAVLIFRPDEGGQLNFVASAVLGGIVPSSPESRGVVAELVEIAPFARPVSHRGLPRAEGVPWISLPSAMFDAILDSAHEGSRPAGLEEAATAFAYDAPALPPLETFAALGQAVKRNYGHICALTGLSEAGRARHRAEDLQITPIRPLSEDGPVHVTNCLVLTPPAAEAFEAGHLAVAGDFRVIVDVHRIDPDLLEAINPLGRLAVPQDESLRPDRRHLAWHRRRFFSLLN
ncbi:hypothetical protein VE25_10685 [Devosia geojensis]|uniref:Uncharacterized protein n=1 Tax=Devosia geojensis TaxID=443610 RepID=A0A0F5FSL4_9HYPH|nr:hypothetical protein [Devosia geojensis]KKB11828.1 hypothetical protein VE25_10685 [Devosia geojensis]